LNDCKFLKDGPLASNNCVFVTGGSGFVGSALKKTLSDHGWLVKVDPVRLLTDFEKWQELLRSVNCVVHLAARVHQMSAESSNSASYQQINVEGSRFVATQAVRAGVRRFIYMSSVKVNGEGGDRPYIYTDEPRPSDPYGCSKLAAEHAIREVCEAGNVEYVIIRPPLVYGPGVKANFNRMINLVDRGYPLPLASIKNSRSLVGLANLVSFVETCMTHPQAASRVWFVADDEPVSTPKLLQKIALCLRREPRLFAFPQTWLRVVARSMGLNAEVARLCDSLLVDSSPAREELDWHSVSSLDDELARTVAAYQDKKRA
jgi:UDP-N-acetyl-alpha-D-quinovosamine dehydrogenase